MFRKFGELADDFESAGLTLIDVTSHSEQLFADGSLLLDVSVGIPIFEKIDTSGIEITLQDSGVLTDETLTVDFSVRVPLDDDSEGHSPEIELERDDHDGEVTAPESKNTSDFQSAKTKPHRNPERLQEVYDKFDTFKEMTAALGADVTSETVRSNMVKHGIHKPKTNGTGEATEEAKSTDGESKDDIHQPETSGEQLLEHDEKTVVSDGFGLPEEITLDEFKSIIHTSRSFLEVQRKLNTDRDSTHQLLKELNLIDLVHGRLSKQSERDPSLEEIDRRIRQKTGAP